MGLLLSRSTSAGILVALLGPALGLTAPAQPPTAAAIPANPAIVQQAVRDGEKVWRAVQPAPAPNLASRDLFTYALALCEAHAHPERLAALFTVATRMQQRDPTHRAYGNFRWSWSHAEVFDFNAVDFCLQAGAILWLRHRDSLPPPARDLLLPLLEHGAQGLLKHRVNESYTNIALMNAGNLLLLGEAMNRPEIAAEGAARLDRIVLHLADAGLHEYVSPTYYGVDLDDVMLIATFSSNERARSQARALWEFVWTDIALNWFPAAGKLAGARSRDYDYLRGLGYLDQQLLANGWIPAPSGRSPGVIFLAYLPAPISPAIRALADVFPRTITQTWGLERSQWRTHFLSADVTLSTAGAGYGGRMDLPLTVDLPSPREGVRGYFIPDGRGDPYGKVKIAESAAHSKTLHLRPFWTAAQRRVDAIGMAVYRRGDVPEGTKTLESHFVLPLDVDEIWIGDQPIRFTQGRAASHSLPPGAAVVVRKGTAMIGVRVPWARDVAGAESAAALVCGSVNYGAMRLTVMHHTSISAQPTAVPPGAAMWVRIGSELDTTAAQTRWRREYATAAPEVETDPSRIRIRVAGLDGPVSIVAAPPFQVAGPIEPGAPRHILACNGDDLGMKLLGAVEPVRSVRAALARAVPVRVPTVGGIRWEAESGVVVPPMTISGDPQSGNGHFVWMPAQPGERAGSSLGRIRFELDVPAAGDRYLWGRVLAPTPENDSFFVAASTAEQTLLEPTAWPTGVQKQWRWVRFTPEAKRLFPLSLPRGRVILEVRVREAGTKIDRLFLATSSTEQPTD